MSYWAKIYGPGEAKASAVDKDGNILIAGEREGNGFIAKLDKMGRPQWFKLIESADFRDLKISPSGDLIVVGSVHTNALVIKLNEEGSIKWQKTYGGEGEDDCIVAVEVVNDGDIILAGWTDSFGAGKRDAWLLRVDGNGNIKWQKTYGGNDDDIAFGVGISKNGDIILGGSTSSFLSNEKDHKRIWVIRMDSNGNIKWQKSYSSVYNLEVLYSLAVVPDVDPVKEEIFVVGDALNVLPINEMMAISTRMPELLGGAFILKLDGHGNVKWRRVISHGNHFSSAVVGPSGEIVLTGYTRGQNKDILLLKLNSAGNIIWQRAYGGSKRDEANTISVLPNGSIFLAGSTESFGVTTKSILALKIPSDGILPNCDFCKELAISIRNDEVQPFNTNCEVYSGYKKIQVEIEEGRLVKRKRKVWKMKYAPLTVTPLTNIAKTVEVKPKTLYTLEKMEENLLSTLHISTPSFTESTSTSLKLTLANSIADSLKATLDLSGNDFLELEETELEFPELKKGQKASKSITVKPKYAGTFDLRIGIKAIVNGIELEAEKVTPVEVRERTVTPQTPVAPAAPQTPAYTPAQFTPSPATPKTFPAELAELYTGVEFIGRGGFARVFRARRKKDGKVVAVKIPISLDAATGKSFLREIENWTKLKHPNIVRVYDYNILPIPFFEMEYCEGSLENLLKRRGYLSPMEAAGIIFEVAEGLKYAHSLRIVHRDLKPSNILLREGTPKISDWGLSKVLKESRSTTFVSFTPYYAAPEQISKSKFGSTDERTDIWQLGVIFYQLVTGRLPFNGEDFVEVSSSIVYETPEKPSEINPDAEPLDSIIMRCLAKRKEERYGSVAELQGELALILGMEYRRSLKESISARDMSRSAYYAGELLLVNLKVGDLAGAYKYAGDLAHYARGEVVKEITALREQIKLRLEEGLDIPQELVEKADVIVHKVKLGWGDV